MSADRVPPDVLGLRVEEARRRLQEAGWTVAEGRTAPPRGGTPGGNERVVRVNRAGERHSLVVAAFPVLQHQTPQESARA